jgi:hypothetical protein
MTLRWEVKAKADASLHPPPLFPGGNTAPAMGHTVVTRHGFVAPSAVAGGRPSWDGCCFYKSGPLLTPQKIILNV